MQDLTLTDIFFIPLLLGGLAVLCFAARIRLLHRCRVAADASLHPLRQKDLPLFYSSYYLKQSCVRRFFRLPQTLEAGLAALAAETPAAALPEVQKALRAAPRNWRLQMLCAELCRILNRRAEFQHIVEQIRLPSPASVLFRVPLSAPAFLRFPLPVPSALKADFLLLTALGELYQTDMYSASAHCSQALRLYQKNGFAWEEAECYMALAQIYRISGVFDVAFTMLREAKKIWQELGIPAKQAETEAYFGLAEIGRENYAAAEEYLAAAARICAEHNLIQTGADVKNWQGLTAYLRHEDDRAAEVFSAVACSKATLSATVSTPSHPKPNTDTTTTPPTSDTNSPHPASDITISDIAAAAAPDTAAPASATAASDTTAPATATAQALSKPHAVSAEARAFAVEMLARISLRRKQYSEALCRADEALALHQKSRHRPGIFENLYLKAEILYASDDYEQSAGILTALIKEKAPAFTTFYPANAYTLLGLINLRQDRLNTARTLFKQAIDLENSQNRIKGAAIDYNNLAELALREGSGEEARTYLQQALSYAEMLEDEELKNYLKAKL